MVEIQLEHVGMAFEKYQKDLVKEYLQIGRDEIRLEIASLARNFISQLNVLQTQLIAHEFELQNIELP